MKRWKPLAPPAVAVALLGVLAGCPSKPSGTGAGTGGGANQDSHVKVNAGGSSFIYPMMSKWTSEYKKQAGAEINYQSKGSGAGIAGMIDKTLDFGCTDAPMNEEQIGKAKGNGGDVTHIPLAMGAVVLAYNLPEVEKPLNLTGPLIAEIYMGVITKWNDAKIAAINEGVSLPDKKIAPFRRSDSSGTTFIFTEYLSKVSPDFAKKVTSKGAALPEWPVGAGAKETAGVAGEVKQTDGGFGYIELLYALKNQIKYANVQNAAGKFVAPSLDSTTQAAAGAMTAIPDDLRYSITNAPGEGSYPIAGTTWMVLYNKQPKGKGEALVRFARWVTNEGQESLKANDYAALPQSLRDKIKAKLDAITFE